MALLSVKDLRIRYRAGKEKTDAVKGISFDMQKGEFVSLVGGSGSGKSSVALAVSRLTDFFPCEVEIKSRSRR